VLLSTFYAKPCSENLARKPKTQTTPMGARRHGQRGHLLPGNVVKCFLCCKCCLKSQ